MKKIKYMNKRMNYVKKAQNGYSSQTASEER